MNQKGTFLILDISFFESCTSLLNMSKYAWDMFEIDLHDKILNNITL